MKRFSIARACAACIAALLLAGCAASGSGVVSVRGQLVSEARTGVPYGSVAVVELARPGDGRVVAEQSIELDGRRFPVGFELKVLRAAMEPGTVVVLRGAVGAGARTVWVTEPVDVRAAADTVDVGALQLLNYRPVASESQLVCGARDASVSVARRRGWDVARLAIGNERFELRQVVAASGARYEAVGDAGTHVWLKGSSASLTVRGKAYPPCLVADGSAAPLRARGNEPAWNLELGHSLRFVAGDSTIEGTAPPMQPGGGERRYAGVVAGRALQIEIAPRICRDTMSGMPHPLVVNVSVDGRTFGGCGGEPAALLHGAEWVVEDIDADLIVRSPPTLEFDAEGRLAGRASCNAYTASYTLTGETLTIGNSATTMKACPEPVMEQERTFLDALRGVRRFDVTDAGALVLHTERGGRMTARRQR
jgi:heat shock protein HslJ/membrane-bound inhibitor of C-type lysozyme